MDVKIAPRNLLTLRPIPPKICIPPAPNVPVFTMLEKLEPVTINFGSSFTITRLKIPLPT